MQVPACLPRLTALHTLAISRSIFWKPPDSLQLPSSLTQLVLEGAASLPSAALSGLPRLHRFAFLRPCESPAGSHQQRSTAPLGLLPAGPWLSALRELVVPAELLAASLPELAGATALQALSLRDGSLSSLALPQQAAVLAWVAARPAALRQLSIDRGGDHLRHDSFARIADLLASRPGLHLEVTPDRAPEPAELVWSSYGELWPEPQAFTSWHLPPGIYRREDYRNPPWSALKSTRT